MKSFTALQVAFDKKNKKTARKLIELGAEDGLFEAVKDKRYKGEGVHELDREVERFRASKQVQYVDNDGDSATGNTVLMEMMAHHDWDDAANDLIVKKCDERAKQGAEKTALHCHLRAPQYRARPGRENVGTNDALFEAAAQENWYYQKDRSHIKSMTESEAEQEFIKLLGKFQPSSTQVMYTSESGSTVLEKMMIHHDWPDATKALIEKKSAMNPPGQDSALRTANSHGRHDAARVLSENGVDALLEAARQEKYYNKNDQLRWVALSESKAEQKFLDLLNGDISKKSEKASF